MSVDNRWTSDILSDPKSLSAIVTVGINPAMDLNPHLNGTSDGDSYYVVSHLQSDGHKFTVLFHLMVLLKPPGPVTVLAMSVLDEMASPALYASVEINDPLSKNTQTKPDLDISLSDDNAQLVGHLSGTMDNLVVEGHATDNQKNKLDFELMMRARGPVLLELGTGIIPVPGNGIDYEFAFPCMVTSGTLTLNGNDYKVNGTSWLDREWGVFAPAKWTWMSMQFNDFQISLWDQQAFDPKPTSHVGGRAFATILKPDGSVTLTTVKVQEFDPSPSNDGSRTYPSKWLVTIPGRQTELTVIAVKTAKNCQDIQSFIAPRLEANCLVEGTYDNNRVTGGAAFVEVGDIPLF